ncbi:DUF1127 domain-containing protein [Wenxinia saemankumensis]|uniref:Uncharacterized conserved protein YjiS, DUF1127 family n=1 Tax=Wenxinia saemankumensis TaxID=1447782 RepID=A0A1M6GSH2_9RHOB|nr:DUF1127 domain-containing protein [Wenxinia saemankumensis]SHJ12874.1 Uncharacterized conserved protein YjiS, DUF1127 family [Wenxinia saemankumensis]
MAYATNTTTLGALRTGGFAEFRAALTERWAQHRTYRATFNELSALNDRDLADLGIARSQIRSIALQAVAK